MEEKVKDKSSKNKTKQKKQKKKIHQIHKRLSQRKGLVSEKKRQKKKKKWKFIKMQRKKEPPLVKRGLDEVYLYLRNVQLLYVFFVVAF